MLLVLVEILLVFVEIPDVLFPIAVLSVPVIIWPEPADETSLKSVTAVGIDVSVNAFVPNALLLTTSELLITNPVVSVVDAKLSNLRDPIVLRAVLPEAIIAGLVNEPVLFSLEPVIIKVSSTPIGEAPIIVVSNFVLGPLNVTSPAVVKVSTNKSPLALICPGT